jgi:hypothetical protein
MQASPLQHLRYRRAYLLKGVKLIKGQIIQVYGASKMLTMKSDDGPAITRHYTHFVFDVVDARSLILGAMDTLKRELEQLEREGAPLQQLTVKGEQYGRVDI